MISPDAPPMDSEHLNAILTGSVGQETDQEASNLAAAENEDTDVGINTEALLGHVKVENDGSLAAMQFNTTMENADGVEDQVRVEKQVRIKTELGAELVANKRKFETIVHELSDSEDDEYVKREDRKPTIRKRLNVGAGAGDIRDSFVVVKRLAGIKEEKSIKVEVDYVENGPLEPVLQDEEEEEEEEEEVENDFQLPDLSGEQVQQFSDILQQPCFSNDEVKEAVGTLIHVETLMTRNSNEVRAFRIRLPHPDPRKRWANVRRNWVDGDVAWISLKDSRVKKVLHPVKAGRTNIPVFAKFGSQEDGWRCVGTYTVVETFIKQKPAPGVNWWHGNGLFTGAKLVKDGGPDPAEEYWRNRPRLPKKAKKAPTKNPIKKTTHGQVKTKPETGSSAAPKAEPPIIIED